jgi:ABC-2 type transport system ATP-binding protein
MKQRLGIAQALLSRPKLLICDEPTSALDPVGRKEILDILRKVKGATTVLFSTHILPDVERVCDRVAVLHGGNIAISGTLAEIKALHGRDRLLLEFARRNDLDTFKSLSLKSLEGVRTPALPLKGTETEIETETETEIILRGADIQRLHRAVIAALAQSGLCPVKRELMEPTLENLFLEVVR